MKYNFKRSILIAALVFLSTLNSCSNTEKFKSGPAVLQLPETFDIKEAVPYRKQYSYNRILVKSVVDGDTLKLENDETVRLIGIDTPESEKNRKFKQDIMRSRLCEDDLIDMGKTAAEFTRKLAEGKYVRIEFDVQKRDRYGRILGYVYILDSYNNKSKLPAGWVVNKKEKPEIFLNATIVNSGYAQQMTIPPNVRYVLLFRKYTSEAREDRRGLWKREGVF